MLTRKQALLENEMNSRQPNECRKVKIYEAEAINSRASKRGKQQAIEKKNENSVPNEMVTACTF
jgi:hypothetical protein